MRKEHWAGLTIFSSSVSGFLGSSAFGAFSVCFSLGLDIFKSAGMDFATDAAGARFTVPKMGDASKVA